MIFCWPNLAQIRRSWTFTKKQDNGLFKHVKDVQAKYKKNILGYLTSKINVEKTVLHFSLQMALRQNVPDKHCGSNYFGSLS